MITQAYDQEDQSSNAETADPEGYGGWRRRRSLAAEGMPSVCGSDEDPAKGQAAVVEQLAMRRTFVKNTFIDTETLPEQDGLLPPQYARSLPDDLGNVRF